MGGGGSTSSDGVILSNTIHPSANGSINALDLSLYHHQYMSKQINKYQESSVIEKNSNGNYRSKYTEINMPHLVHALNETQEMGMKLVQVLDFESIYDNPVEEKYRT